MMNLYKKLSLVYRLGFLFLYYIVKHQRWTEEETNLLVDHYHSCTIEQLCNLLPSRNKRQILQKAFTLKLFSNPWTEDEDKLLWFMVDYAEVHKLFPQKHRISVSRRIAYLKSR